MAEAALLLLPEAAAERDAREKLSLWDRRPDSMAPLTDRQTDSVLELKAALENLPVPAEVRRARELRPASCPVRGSGQFSGATVADSAGGACVCPAVSLALPATPAGPARVRGGPREGVALPQRRGTVGLSLTPGFLLLVFPCQRSPASHEPEVLCSRSPASLCQLHPGVIGLASSPGAEGHLEGIRTGPEKQFHSSHTKL